MHLIVTFAIYITAIASAAHPECRYACDDPVCPALCHPVCAPPRCEVQCLSVPNAQCDRPFVLRAACPIKQKATIALRVKPRALHPSALPSLHRVKSCARRSNVIGHVKNQPIARNHDAN